MSLKERLDEKKAMMLADRLGDSEAISRLCHIVASIEREQLEAVLELETALEIDHLNDVPDVEERQEFLQELIVATVSGRFDSWWLETVADEFLADADVSAEPYLGMGSDSEAWQESVEGWAAAYRDRLEDVDELSDRDLADQHVRSTWGVPLEDFEREIVDFERGPSAEILFASNFRAAREGVQIATEEVSDD